MLSYMCDITNDTMLHAGDTVLLAVTKQGLSETDPLLVVSLFCLVPGLCASLVASVDPSESPCFSTRSGANLNSHLWQYGRYVHVVHVEVGRGQERSRP